MYNHLHCSSSTSPVMLNRLQHITQGSPELRRVLKLRWSKGLYSGMIRSFILQFIPYLIISTILFAFWLSLHHELTFQSIIHSDSQMWSSLDAAEKHKNTIALIFLLIQHTTWAAEKLLKLSVKDAHSAIEYTSYNNPGKEKLRKVR